MICHLVKSENHLGRSLVIDLNAEAPNNFRQVDHRTIKSIILKNVKYTLGKKSTLDTLQDWSFHPTFKWNPSKLAVGDWFSENQYYKITDTSSAQMIEAKVMNESGETYCIPIHQLHDMYCGNLFEEEKQVTRTELVEILLNARESVFTCTFHKKVTPEYVKDLLTSVSSDTELQAKCKELSKLISLGEETTLTCFLLKSEEKLGRSCVIDLNEPHGKNFRQIDHRSITSIILQNVKYSMKH